MFLDRLYKSLTPLVLALALSGCSDYIEDPGLEPVPGAPGTLTIQLSNINGSRSPESNGSETKIDNVIVCLYPTGATDDTQAAATGIFTGRNANVNDKVTMYLTDEMIKDLFNDGTDQAQCKLFVVANYPQNAELSEKPSISDLKNISVTSTFRTVPVQTSFIMAGDGTVTYTAPAVAGNKGTAGGSANLSRAAAKIQLNVNLPSQITVTNASGVDEIWESQADNTFIAMLNRGVKTSIAYPEGTAENPYTPGNDDYYYDSDASNTVKSCRILSSGSGNTTHPYGINVPFYTYPNAWSEDGLETNTTNITLRVRWGKRVNGTVSEWANYYYQVPVTPVGVNYIESNNSYTINLTVGMLGSLNPETPTEIEGEYQIVNWSDKSVYVDIKDFRYLVVNPNEVTIDNEANILIPFYSSHPLKEDMDITMTFQRFNFFNGNDGDVVNITIPKETIDASVSGDEKMVTYDIVKDGTQSYIRINHPLLIWTPKNVNGNTVSLTDVQDRPTNPTEQNIQNAVNTYVSRNIDKFVPPTTAAEIADAVPYSSYVFNIKIQHADNPKYSADIKVTQNPGMYIQADRNPGLNNTGNVYVNNGEGNYGGVHGLAATNKNPNMYLITISQLDESEGYYIGDPRMEYTSNSLTTQTGNIFNRRYPDLTTATSNDQNAGSWSVDASALYMAPTATGTTRRLTYYYPTIEEQSVQFKMRVAPKFRVASSYGVTSTINRDGARRRVASYQECGRPAGRWRLPTYGELQFIVSLSSKGKIPLLFNIGASYWTAQGLCRINNDGTITLSTSTTDEGYVKGVYDDWYWDQYPQYTPPQNANGTFPFRWGDVPRP